MVRKRGGRRGRKEREKKKKNTWRPFSNLQKYFNRVKSYVIATFQPRFAGMNVSNESGCTISANVIHRVFATKLLPLVPLLTNAFKSSFNDNSFTHDKSDNY